MNPLKPLSSSRPDLSFIVPMYNEEDVVPVFFDRIFEVIGKLELSVEIVCVNDGSTDATVSLLREYRSRDSRVKYIDFSRNFGKEIALTAGLDHASGKAVIILDADLQDPPELIFAFVEKWREGYEVVYGARRSRDADSWLKKATASAFYRLMDRIAGVGIPSDAGDFRLMDRRVVDALSGVRERNRFMKGLFAWVGYKHIGIPYDRPERAAGGTKFGFWRLWNFALDGITGFSTLPLRFAGYLGLLVATLSILYGAYLLVWTLAFGRDVPGYASLMVSVLILGGLQLMFLGVIGEYIGRIYEETKQRPIYLIQHSAGFDNSAATSRAAFDLSHSAGLLSDQQLAARAHREGFPPGTG